MSTLPDTAAITRINDLQEKIEQHQSSMVSLAVEAGTELLKLKEQTPEGEWMKYCADNIQISRASINRYMLAAENADLLPDYSRVSNPSLRGFLKHIQAENQPKKVTAPKKHTPVRETVTPLDLLMDGVSAHLDAQEDLTTEECLERLSDITNHLPAAVRRKLLVGKFTGSFTDVVLSQAHGKLMKKLLTLSRVDSGKLVVALLAVLEHHHDAICIEAEKQKSQKLKDLEAQAKAKVREYNLLVTELRKDKTAINMAGTGVMLRTTHRELISYLQPDKPENASRQVKATALTQTLNALKDEYPA